MMGKIHWIFVVILLFFHFVAVASEDRNGGETRDAVENIRIFSGYTISKEGRMLTPSVVTLIEMREKIDCRFIAFVGVPLEFRDIVKIPENSQKIVFQGEETIMGEGVTNDPRGFRVKWSAELSGHQITGRFEQPYDEGDFTLHEAYIE